MKSTIGAMLIMSVCFLFSGTKVYAAIFTNGAGGLPYSGYVCMDIRGGSSLPGAVVQAWDCHGWSNQQWTMQGYTIYGIGSTGSAQNCLTVNGFAVEMNPCTGSLSQQWYFRAGMLVNPSINNRCLDATLRSNGTPLVMNPCSSASSQQWQIK